MIAPPKPPPHDELEALIKEARAHQLRRRLVGAAGVAVAAAIGLTVFGLVTAGMAKRPTISRAVHPQAALPCSAAGGWRLAVNGGWSEPTGQHTAPFIVTRTGASACTLTGYPKVSLLDAEGHALRFRYSHRGDLVVAMRRPHPVRVGGHDSAYFLLNKYRCDVHAVGAARWLHVSLPGVHGTLVLRLPHYPIIDYCPVAGPSTTIAVSPIVAGLAQATAKLP